MEYQVHIHGNHGINARFFVSVPGLKEGELRD